MSVIAVLKLGDKMVAANNFKGLYMLELFVIQSCNTDNFVALLARIVLLDITIAVPVVKGYLHLLSMSIEK